MKYVLSSKKTALFFYSFEKQVASSTFLRSKKKKTQNANKCTYIYPTMKLSHQQRDSNSSPCKIRFEFNYQLFQTKLTLYFIYTPILLLFLRLIIEIDM